MKASGAGAVLAAGSVGAVPFTSSRAFAQQSWDAEHDIVVVGSGGAGFSAAITGHTLGSDVVILEKGSYVGGTSLVSGGGMWIPNNTPMREAGIEDPRDDCLRYMAKYSFPQYYNPDDEKLGLPDHDYEMISAYYDNASAAMDLIQDAGVCQWMSTTNFGPHFDTVQTDYMDYPENLAPQGRTLGPVVEGSEAQGGGGDMIGYYQAWAEKVGVPILLNHRVDRVVLNDLNEVIGVEVTVIDPAAAAATPEATPVTGKTLAIRARKGVVFGSGGFARNEDMMRHLMPAPYYGGCSAPTNEGDFLRISSAVSAKLGNLHNVWRNEGIFEQAIASSGAYNCVWYYSGDSFLMVNKEGKRFVNEKRQYQDRPMAHLNWDANNGDWTNRLSFFVYDTRMQENWGGQFPFPADPDTTPYIITADTLEELATLIDERVQSLAAATGGVTLSENFTETFVAEVAKFNEYATTGDDLDFQRGNFSYDVQVPHGPVAETPTIEYPSADQASVAMYPLAAEGPYYAFIVTASAVDTSGGPVINSNGQILTWADEPVVGLYGAGNCVACPGVNAYWGGGATLGNAHTWGHQAAKHAHNSAGTSA
jgi:hypothetical protein